MSSPSTPRGPHPAPSPAAPTLLACMMMLVAMLPGCMTIKVDVPPRPAVPAQFAEVGAAATATDNAHPAGVAVPTATTQEIARWWQAIPDPTLNRFIEQGLSANADIRIAVARVREARTVVSMAESALYPSIAAYAGIGREKVNQVHPPGLPAPLSWPDINIPMSTFDGSGFAAAWEVDVFGSRRSDADAARQAALAVEERLHGAQMIVAADIASNYIEARSIERRQQVLQRSLKAAQRLQRYAQGRFDAGQATRLDTDRAQAQVESIAAMQAPLQTLLAARLRRIAVLTGQPPEALTALPAPTAQAPADASVIPALLPGVLPSDVLERRPDVRGSANQVRALAARLGSAKAEVLPKFYLGFLSNDGRLAIGDLPSMSSGFTAWGAGVKLPIFEGGRIKANIEASDARLDAAVAQYEQTVMTALEDVENAYGARHALDQRAERLTAAWHSQSEGARHAEALFNEGTGLLQPALEAELQALQREDELIQAHTARALTTVMLYKAIGGGWSPQAPSPK